MPDFEYIVGTLEGLEEKASGWTTVKVGYGRQYPRKLETKKEEIIDQARAARGQTATWKYTVRESENINEHTGKPYINRYLEAVKIGDHMPADYTPEHQRDVGNGGSGGRASSPAGGRRNDEDRSLSKEEWRAKDSAADRRACIAISAESLKHTVPADPTPEQLNEFIKRVEHVSAAFHKIVSAERDGQAEAASSEPREEPTSGGVPDDDIPF